MKNGFSSLLRSIAIVAALVGSAWFVSTQFADSTSFLTTSLNRVTAAMSPRAGVNDPFDGPRLYKEAFEAFRDYHKSLADDAVRAKWVAEWEHKFDKSGELKTEVGTDAAIEKMMESLGQRFDYFMGVEATEGEVQQVDASLVGIGVTLKLNDAEGLIKALSKKPATRAEFDDAMIIGKGHELSIEGAIEGGPSDNKLKAGDVITHVDGKAIAGLKMADVIKSIRGKAGTVVELTVDRIVNGKTTSVVVKITRAVVKIKVVHTKDLGNGISYIKLDNFMSKNALDEMKAALLAASKGKGVIIDLRGNPGGELGAVINITSHILSEGTVLITEQRAPAGAIGETQYIAARDFMLRVTDGNITAGPRPTVLLPESMPIVVLVDGGSASASEILAGALKAHKRALIVGKPTVGKGVGQSVIDLSFGRRLHVTSFEFLPGGKRMDWIGVIPDVDVDQDKTGDKQLDEATTRIQKMIGDEEAATKKSDDLKKGNQTEFDKELQKRSQKRSERLGQLK